jgi:hypothetical protein
MLYFTEVPVADDDLTEPMTRMRTWLDHQGFEPSGFRLTRTGLQRKVRVSFRKEAEAIAFASAFNGALLTRPTADALVS